MSGQPEAITRDELAWVLKRHGGMLSAVDLVEEIEANRDSTRYESGGVYRDPEGNPWVFDRALGDGSPHWLRPGLEGSFEYATPRRPLTPLVPEGSPLADSERDLIRRDLGQMLDLLGLGDFARPASSHEVFAMCLEAVAGLTGKREETCPGGC